MCVILGEPLKVLSQGTSGINCQKELQNTLNASSKFLNFYMETNQTKIKLSGSEDMELNGFGVFVVLEQSSDQRAQRRKTASFKHRKIQNCMQMVDMDN